MICKIFIRTFPSTEECDLFESILQTRWPSLLEGTKGVTFEAYRNKQSPNISTVVWRFPDESTQLRIEAMIQEHITRFTQTLSPKTISYTGVQTLTLET